MLSDFYLNNDYNWKLSLRYIDDISNWIYCPFFKMYIDMKMKKQLDEENMLFIRLRIFDIRVWLIVTVIWCNRYCT